MKVIRNSLAKNILQYESDSKDCFKPLNKLLDESAICSLLLDVKSNGSFLATLNIIDGKLNAHSTGESVNPFSAINLAVNKCVQQLSKKNGKNQNMCHETIRVYDASCLSKSIDENVQLENPTNSILEVFNFEKQLKVKKQTAKYENIVKRYINYLYLDQDIDRAENQLSVLYSFLENIDYEKISYAEMLRLTESVELLNDEINFLLHKKRSFETNTKIQNDVNEIILDEVKLLNLKRENNL